MEPSAELASQQAIKKAGEHAEAQEVSRQALAKEANQEIAGLIAGIGKRFDDHAADDKRFQERLEPMVKLFEQNTIVKLRFREDTSTLVFYAKSASVIAAFVAGAYLFIKYVIARLP